MSDERHHSSKSKETRSARSGATAICELHADRGDGKSYVPAAYDTTPGCRPITQLFTSSSCNSKMNNHPSFIAKPDFAKIMPPEFGDYLDQRVHALLANIEVSEPYQSVFAPDANPHYIVTVIKHVLMEVFSYGPHVTEATFTAIGRFPKKEVKFMEKLALHDVEEADHGEMALTDAVKLGLNEEWARKRLITPESFVVGAAVRLIATQLNPFAYLGYMYPFEALTPILTQRLQRVLAAKQFPCNATHFVDYHAVADIGHAATLRKLIEEIVGKYSEAKVEIDYAFDIFSSVYPLPIWKTCVARARAESEI